MGRSEEWETERVTRGDKNPFIPFPKSLVVNEVLLAEETPPLCGIRGGIPFPEVGAGAYSLVVGSVFVELLLETRYVWLLCPPPKRGILIYYGRKYKFVATIIE
jgi:hypothetical protein